MVLFLFILLYKKYIIKAVIIIIIIKRPNMKFLIKIDKIISAKYAIKIQPTIEPADIAKKIFQGFIPINLPIIDPTRPPEP